jgi:tetratricopeptide (TPR) repeat protein
VAFLAVAVVAAVLALTSDQWVSGLPRLFGTIGANSGTVSILADVAQLAQFALWAAAGLFGLLGLRSFRGANTGTGPTQTVDAAQGGRGAAVGGDVNQGAVVAGDNNRVSLTFTGGATYDYAHVSPSPVEPGELGEARRRLEEMPLEEVPDRAALPPGSVVPLRPYRHFVGREGQLKWLAASLKAGGATAIGEVAVAASSGLGGVGKTQLASEFVHRYGQYFHGVYWLNFGDESGVPTEVASCGGAGGMRLRPDFHRLPLEERVRAVMAAWQGELPRLLVFDNCEEEELLDLWLPPSGGCRVLVTSRRGSWDPSLGVAELPLDVLDRWESVALLREYRPDLPADSPECEAVAEELGDLPLALDLAGRYLARHRREVSPADYLESIRRPDLLEHPSLRRARGISPTKHEMDVWRTFALSYRRLDPDDEANETARRLLARAARLAPGEPIPGTLLAWTLVAPGGGDDPPRPTAAVRDALDRLTGLGLLQGASAGSGGEAFRMHRLVAAFALAEAPGAGAQEAVEAACTRAALRASRGGRPAEQEKIIPHLRASADAARERGDYMEANLCGALGTGLLQLKAYDEAMPYAERAWEISARLYGRDDPGTLQRRSNVGVLLKQKGDWEAARAVYAEVLEAQERVLGREHPDVAATMNNLGALLRHYDLYHEMLPLYGRALRIRERVWAETGPHDPVRWENAYRVAESYMNMGALLMDLGRHRAARPHLERALTIGDRELGKNHERNANTLVLISLMLRAQGDYGLAVASADIALDIYREVYDGLPPAVANALATQGVLFKELADRDGSLSPLDREQALRQAEGALRAALDGAEHFYGEDDPPLTGGILWVLSEVREAQGAAEDARTHRERAEACRAKHLGAVGADAAAALNGSGTSLADLGLYDESRAYLERALNIREDSLGERDFDTSTSLLKLGIVLQLQGQDGQARPHLERALSVRSGICGESHPATELVRENLALLGA